METNRIRLYWHERNKFVELHIGQANTAATLAAFPT